MALVTDKLDKARLSAADWEQAALDVIAETGIAAVKVESLARDLDCTKGSFYWHFSGRDELIKSALARWESEDQAELLEIVAHHRDPKVRLRELFRAGSRGSHIHTVYSALFASVDHPLAAPVMERVTERRLQYLNNAFENLGLAKTQAAHRARLTYTAYVGFLQLARQRHGTHMHGDEYESYVAHMMETLIPS